MLYGVPCVGASRPPFSVPENCLDAVVRYIPEPYEREDASIKQASLRRVAMKQLGRASTHAEIPAYRVAGPRLPLVIVPVEERGVPEAVDGVS